MGFVIDHVWLKLVVVIKIKLKTGVYLEILGERQRVNNNT